MNGNKKNHKREDEEIDRIDEDSFPASDPPPWTGSRTGAPKRNGEKRDKKKDK